MESTLHVIRVNNPKKSSFYTMICCCFSRLWRQKKSKEIKYPRVQYRRQVNTVELSGYKQSTIPPPGQASAMFREQVPQWPRHLPLSDIIKKCDVSSKKRTPQDLCSYTSYDQESSIDSPFSSHSLPSLTFSVFYDHQLRCLLINIVEGHNFQSISPKLAKNTQIVFVTVSLLPHKSEFGKTTPVKESFDNPFFNESFKVTNVNYSAARQQTLVLRVYLSSYYALKRTFVGAVEFRLKKCHLLGNDITRNLTSQVKDFSVYSVGDLQLSLSYWPSKEILEGYILKVSNLQEKFYAGVLPDPYVNAVLMYKQNKQAKWRSTTNRSAINSSFDEMFSFSISKMELNQTSLRFTVKDNQKFGFSTRIGIVEIGPHVLEDLGQRHWNEMVSSPYQAVTWSHSILSEDGRRKMELFKSTSENAHF